MRKIDHIRKVVYIIVGILTIISLVFTLYKKIGKAASSDSVIFYRGFPLYYGGSIAHADIKPDSFYTQIVDDAINFSDNYISGYPVIVLKLKNSSNFGVCVLTSSFSSPQMPNTVSTSSSFRFTSGYYLTYNSDGTRIGSSYAYNTYIYYGKVFDNINGTLVYILSDITESYPVYIYNAENFTFSNGVQIFTKYHENVNPSGHNKGGVLANYQNSFDLLEDSSDVPKVDTSTPTDSSSVPAWLGKILNGLGVIGNSIQSGVLTIGDYIGTLGENIGEFFNSVGEKIDAIKDSIDSFFAWVTEAPNNETILSNIQPYLESNTMIQGFISSKNAIQSVYSDISGVNAKTSSQMKWSIPFNLPGLSNNFTATIDFGWYENIRSIVQPILIMIISVSFILSLIRSIPGILHGNSPEGDT